MKRAAGIRVWALSFAALLSLQGCAPLLIAGLGAGVGTTVYVLKNRRTASVVADDNSLERQALNRLGEAFGSSYHVNVTLYNKIALLTGEVPDGRGKVDVESVVSSIQEIRKVYNYLSVGKPSSFAARSKDALVTSNVKALLAKDDRISALDVKAVTESQMVYLMGLLTSEEAAIATDIVRRGDGVAEVVPLFEILAPDDPRIDTSQNKK